MGRGAAIQQVVYQVSVRKLPERTESTSSLCQSRIQLPLYLVYATTLISRTMLITQNSKRQLANGKYCDPELSLGTSWRRC